MWRTQRCGLRTTEAGGNMSENKRECLTTDGDIVRVGVTGQNTLGVAVSRVMILEFTPDEAAVFLQQIADTFALLKTEAT